MQCRLAGTAVWLVYDIISHPLSLSCLKLSWADKHLLSQLQYFDLSDNQLVGALPESWGNLISVSPITNPV